MHSTRLRVGDLSLWQWLFVWLMLDSLILYLLRPFFFLPINAMLPILVLVALLLDKKRSAKIAQRDIAFWVLMAAGLLLAFVVGVESLFNVSKQYATALSAFIIGVKSIDITGVSDKFLKLISLVGLAYAFVCAAAVLGISPVYLPVSYLEGFNDGVPVIRAEITTDQNYQVFYLFPLLLSLVVKHSPILRVLQLAGLLAALYVIVEMQTRSGLIVMLGFTLLITLLPFWYRQKGSILYVLLFALGVSTILVINLSLIIELSQNMLRRFTDSDLSTFWGRVDSIGYLFKNLLDPGHWLPKGQDYFLARYGNYPHSSPTSIYLSGGILGLIGWLYIVIKTSASSIKLLIKKRVGLNESVIVAGAFSAFVVCLTLPAPFFEQLWLWIGGAAGVVLSYRYRLVRSFSVDKEGRDE